MNSIYPIPCSIFTGPDLVFTPVVPCPPLRLFTCHCKYSSLVLTEYKYSVVYSVYLSLKSSKLLLLSPCLSPSPSPPDRNLRKGSTLVVLVVESNWSQLRPGRTSAQTSDLCPRPFTSGLDRTPYRSRPRLDSISDSHLCGFTIQNFVCKLVSISL